MSSILFASCKKMDYVIESQPDPALDKFFKIPANAPTAVYKVAAEFKRQNAINSFIPTLIKQSGYPVWDKAQVYFGKGGHTNSNIVNNFGEGEDTIAIVPFLEENGNQVSAFIISRINNGTKLYLYRANDYDRFRYGGVDAEYISSDKIVYQLVLLNEAVFGHRKYALSDTMLFRDRIVYDSAYRTIELNGGGALEQGIKRPSVTANNVSGGYYVELCGWTRALNFTGTTNNGGVVNNITPGTVWACRSIYAGPENIPPIVIPPMGGGGGTSGGGGGTCTGCGDPINTDCTGLSTCGMGPEILNGNLPCGACGPSPLTPVDDNTGLYTDDEIDSHYGNASGSGPYALIYLTLCNHKAQDLM